MVLVSIVNPIGSIRTRNRKCQQMIGRNNPPYFFLLFFLLYGIMCIQLRKGVIIVLSLKPFMFSFLLATILFILVGAQLVLDKDNKDEPPALIVYYIGFSCLATTTAIIYGILCFVMWG